MIKSLLATLILTLSLSASASSWNAYIIDSTVNEVQKIGALHFVSATEIIFTNSDQTQMNCAISTPEKDSTFPIIIEPDFVLKCSDEAGSKSTIAVENHNGKKMLGLLLEDIGNPIFFLQD